MACEYCHWTSRHPSSCPNADEPISYAKCELCGEGIYEGEEYINNDDGEFIHYDCSTISVLVEFLGYKVQTMRGDDY